MTNEERLAEIEAWVGLGRRAVEFGEYPLLLTAPKLEAVDCLIARVRELEAQVALDAAVREAAHVLVNKGIDMVIGCAVDPTEEADALKDVATLRAALAARMLAEGVMG
jgi:hypothetical protein